MPKLKQLQDQLQNHQTQGLWRLTYAKGISKMPYICLDGKQYLHGCCNDYLGLSQHPIVTKACMDAARHYGVGAQASPAASGQTKLHRALQDALAQHYNQERALLFSSGYHANSAMLQTLIGPQESVFHDKLTHASLVRTLIQESFNHTRYPHMNHDRLDSLLVKDRSESATWIVTDTVFSMTGTMANLPKLYTLAKRHGAYLLLDNTHGLGCIDPLLEHPLIGTGAISCGLGKAIGAQGGAVIGPTPFIEALEQWAPQYMFSTALAPPIAAAALASLEVLKQEPERLSHLKQLIAHFTNLSEQAGLAIKPSTTPIQILDTSSAEQAMRWAEQLKEKGFFIHPIRPPTIPGNKGCLRLSITYHNTLQHMESWVEALTALCT